MASTRRIERAQVAASPITKEKGGRPTLLHQHEIEEQSGGASVAVEERVGRLEVVMRYGSADNGRVIKASAIYPFKPQVDEPLHLCGGRWGQAITANVDRSCTKAACGFVNARHDQAVQV